jgi:hypothetical protein
MAFEQLEGILKAVPLFPFLIHTRTLALYMLKNTLMRRSYRLLWPPMTSGRLYILWRSFLNLPHISTIRTLSQSALVSLFKQEMNREEAGPPLLCGIISTDISGASAMLEHASIGLWTRPSEHIMVYDLDSMVEERWGK